MNVSSRLYHDNTIEQNAPQPDPFQPFQATKTTIKNQTYMNEEISRPQQQADQGDDESRAESTNS